MGAEEKDPEFSENPVIAPVLCGCCCSLRAGELEVPVLVLVVVSGGEFFFGVFPPDFPPLPLPLPLSFSTGAGEELAAEGDEAENIRSLAS